MRPAAPWTVVLLVAAVALSGCARRNCDFSRWLVWEQGGFLDGAFADREASHRQGAVYGQANRILAEPPYETLVQVWAYEPGERITRDQLFAFTRELFAVHGFPEPTFEGALESTSCPMK